MANNVTARTGDDDIGIDEAAAGPTRIPIERLDKPDPEAFERSYREPGKPVIFSGAMKDWPAVKTWTPEFFAERYGDVEVRTTINLPDTAVPSLHPWAERIRQMKVRDFVAFMKTADKPCYIDSIGVHFFPGIEGDLRFHEIVADTRGREISIVWIGSKATHSGLHFDRYDNLFGQVYGEKVVCLMSPEDSAYLYQFADVMQKSHIDPENPDLAKYPKFAKATVYETVLKPGDVLFIPNLWWHSLRSTSASISTNFWFGKDADIGLMFPIAKAGGIRVMARMAWDFIWLGMLGRRYTRRLLCEDPNGLWLYQMVRDAVRRRLGRAGEKD